MIQGRFKCLEVSGEGPTKTVKLSPEPEPHAAFLIEPTPFGTARPDNVTMIQMDNEDALASLCVGRSYHMTLSLCGDQ